MPWQFEADETSSGAMFGVYNEDGTRITEPYIGERSARLIAAAPELLEVAQRCLAMVSEGAGPPNWDWIREVIAKATA